MLWTDASRHVSIGIATTAGVIAGALLAAVASRSRPPRRLPRHPRPRPPPAGAILMGFGGVTALGCTIGQGLSGLSTALGGRRAHRGRHHRRCRPHPQGPAKTLDVPVKSAKCALRFGGR